jgi:uncharacterized protein DUF6519
MKGDFARVSFDPTRHFSQVFQQQGRVQLESDWNEQASIGLYLLRSMVTDLVGPCWAAGTGFSITRQNLLANWQLSPGHFYVDGILCENDAPCTFATQPYAPTPGNGFDLAEPPPAFVVWMDVWERHLSATEAPSILDVALDGIDTATRAQVVWQLRLTDTAVLGPQLDTLAVALKLRIGGDLSDTEKAQLQLQLNELTALRRNLDAGQGDPCTTLRAVLNARATYAWPRLRAQAGPVDSEDDPCVIAADARYRGLENQLYRVEIHDGAAIGPNGTAIGASFKWSRENGSVIFPVTGAMGGSAQDGSPQLVVTLSNLGRDQRLGLAANEWVEVLDDNATLSQVAAPLLQVVAIDAAHRTVTLQGLKGDTIALPSLDQARHALLRRWDQQDGVTTEGVLPVDEGGWITLEDGLQVWFEPGGAYETGDYWQVPARVAGNGSLDWPVTLGTPDAVKSRGMHHRAALGVSTLRANYTECCCRIVSLCEQMQAASGAKKTTPGTITPAPSRPSVPVAPARPTKTAKATVKSTRATKAGKTVKATRATRKAR